MTKAGAVLVEVLAAHGVTHVFGLIGSSTMEVYDALFDHKDVRYIGAKDERAAAGMADGFARTAGRLGVVMAGQSGPGVTNLVSGLAAAKAARSPVVSIGGAVSTGHWQLDAFQEVDQETLLAPVTKAVLAAYRGDRVADVVDRACRLALTHPMGPVHVNVPRDVLAEECAPTDRADIAPITRPAVADRRAADEAVRLLAAARRPVLVAGAGVKWTHSGELVVALSQRFEAPVATSAGHRDSVPNDHGLFLGQMGARGSALANEVIREADLVLGIGTRFGFNSTFFDPTVFAPDATVVQSDVDPAMLGRYVTGAHTVHADSRALCELLLDATEGVEPSTDTSWATTVGARADAMRRDRRTAPPDAPSLNPDVFFHVMRGRLPRNTIVTLDAGTWCLKASELLDFYQTPSMLTPLDFASLGFAFPAAIGAKIASPDRPCVAAIGDGGALFAISELATLREYDVPVVLLIMDNNAWGAEKAYQQDYYEGRFIGSDLPSNDFVAIAEGFGVRARRAATAAELADCLDEAIAANEPRVVSVAVDPGILHSFRKDIFGKA
ncbi:MAG: thiamine pyrophosphate-binding protein [Actinophytocola sp.]|uniref:thiamine pyrophosphate-binding protein n=1 Tax=Actinophytocola sp. TaxID=1872138 RepID=UPI00132250A7|nr:thiamine pyrophosphate-binding protein [Actinophytocola sp.]MPZ79710.1 thiamine pyrophosphate-binding protein [Actinophytocola sp.]